MSGLELPTQGQFTALACMPSGAVLITCDHILFWGIGPVTFSVHNEHAPLNT